MKRFLKIMSLVLAVMLSLSVFTGCGDVLEELFDVFDIVTDFEVVYDTYPDGQGAETLPNAPPSDEGDLR